LSNIVEVLSIPVREIFSGTSIVKERGVNKVPVRLPRPALSLHIVSKCDTFDEGIILFFHSDAGIASHEDFEDCVGFV